MKKLILCLLLITFVSGCNTFEAGKIKPKRKELYDYNNNTEYCQKNPNRCVNNIPW